MGIIYYDILSLSLSSFYIYNNIIKKGLKTPLFLLLYYGIAWIFKEILVPNYSEVKHTYIYREREVIMRDE